jgi:tetratricopeptide (TPR) repeat protein
MESPGKPTKVRIRITRALLCCLVAAVSLAYSNHFNNGFHFDDSHTVVDNPYIRSLQNIPKFFTDATTFSAMPSSRMYRPVISTSLALDYWAAGGLKPLFFHLSTFVWYLVQLVLMFLLFRHVFDQVRPSPRNSYFAFFAAAWYGVHPAMAETVNYVIQRGDLLSTLGVVAAIYLYAVHPRWRRYHLYLVPAVLAQLSKPPALIFPLILLTYILLFEEGFSARQWLGALRNCLPALLATVVLAILQARMTPPTFLAGASSAFAYRITQPLVALRYFVSFFLPLWLSADTDHRPLENVFGADALLGFGFVAALVAVAIWSGRRKDTRPVAFGLVWFLLALAPTSVFPLAEVENDHRMFFPFVGLALAVVWAIMLAVYRGETAAAAGNRRQVALGAIAIVVLIGYGVGTRHRNEVWHTDESLWRDVTIKSPRNGRGLMNYGLTQMSKGDYRTALDYFERALAYTPAYPYLEVNLGIASGGLNRDAEAEKHFLRALVLASGDAVVHYYYARWLKSKSRTAEALEQATAAATLNPTYLNAAYLQMDIFAERQDWAHLKAVATETLRLSPNDPVATSHLQRAAAADRQLPDAEQLARANPTPENYLNLSLMYHRSGKYQECIDAARQALRLKPDYAEAYNNIAAAYQSMAKWDEAIQAAGEALRINPNYQLARNNLLWSAEQKRNAGQTSRR